MVGDMSVDSEVHVVMSSLPSDLSKVLIWVGLRRACIHRDECVHACERMLQYFVSQNKK